ncbi:alpha-mannosidase [Butyrivibrio sp. YAB3001]|uniref:alpha-mannosidase n=1 Tax=Butyrivibrio sp. YAB3001 TaxID=1520812 RepID=UPI0008F61991|nr:glycoside hydrolase family 38 C-terminal domain-containing protein [Butyrivibrio sp. YAB3001]SFC31697.1 alpha-mannosidase [Butyrivibrio sp. YAB3001]
MVSKERLIPIENVLNKLKSQMFGNCASIVEVLAPEGIRCKKVPYEHRQELFEDYTKWETFEPGTTWGEPDGHELFAFKICIPEKFYGKEVFFFLSTGADDIWNTDNPQMLIYINGNRRSGMDMNHNIVSIYSADDWEKETSRTIDIRIYAYSNLSENGNYLDMKIAALDEVAQKAYFDLLVPFDAAKAMLGIDSRQNAIDLLSDKESVNVDKPIDEKNADVILKTLEKACNLIIWGKESDDKGSCIADTKSLKAALDYLWNNLYGTGENPAIVACVGHTHIDVAWKWQTKQTREKVIRSYSTVMELMKRYPEYLFMASTPQMYEYVREEEPQLFDEICSKVNEGRFEPEGAMWLEADCNLTSGESLVRQILYGKKYFKEKFGIESTILWLPDVFGYSAAMPQILNKSGIRAFVTTKLAWNDTNRLPYDLFYWEGIDRSRIPAYIITTCDFPKADQVMNEGGILNYTYNGRQDASQIMGTWRAFREKEITDEVLSCYGFGDGGGGPTWEMLEMDRRLRAGIPGVPKTVQKTVTEFFGGLLEKLEKNEKVPTWSDELYLEFHRGTYTSMGKNKRYNRKLEYLLKEAEILCVYKKLTDGSAYPKENLMNAWKVLMLNQFHDILPGSSIEEVYKDSWEEYEAAISEVKEIISKSLVQKGDILEKKDPVTTGYYDTEICKDSVECTNIADEVMLCCEKGKNDFPAVFFTDYYSISIDENGQIVSLYDIENKRELRDKSGTALNHLIAFEDKPREYDCWNIDADFVNVYWDITKAQGIEAKFYCSSKENSPDLGKTISADVKGERKFVADNGRIEICIERRFRKSTIWQTIILYAKSRRIDFKTKVDWHEHQILLKAAFPVDIEASEISCEVQFGSIKRKLKKDNSWDKAKFECCAHKWIDITSDDGDYGVAILNDCKYGYDAKEKLMRLTLIKSGIFPNPNADQGIHEFTYSLLPHKGNHIAGKVIEEARKLNENNHYWAPQLLLNRFKTNSSEKAIDTITKELIDIERDGIFVEAIKLSENSEDIIIRLYEGYGRDVAVKVKLFQNMDILLESVVECNLMEEAIEDDSLINTDENAAKELSMTFKPFEIKTLKIRTQKMQSF